MPRIYTSASDALDFCAECFPDESEAEELYGNEAITGEGPDDRGNCFSYDACHPEYTDLGYTCETCGKVLTWADDEVKQ